MLTHILYRIFLIAFLTIWFCFLFLLERYLSSMVMTSMTFYFIFFKLQCIFKQLKDIIHSFRRLKSSFFFAKIIIRLWYLCFSKLRLKTMNHCCFNFGWREMNCVFRMEWNHKWYKLGLRYVYLFVFKIYIVYIMYIMYIMYIVYVVTNVFFYFFYIFCKIINHLGNIFTLILFSMYTNEYSILLSHFLLFLCVCLSWQK